MPFLLPFQIFGVELGASFGRLQLLQHLPALLIHVVFNFRIRCGALTGCDVGALHRLQHFGDGLLLGHSN